MSYSNTARLAQNTLFLYGRLLVVMLISLYTSRLVLEYLGVSNYGIYNVVAGIVTMLTFLRGTLAGSIQRFLAISIGKNDADDLSKTFSISVNVQIFASLLFIVIIETIGIWFLNYKMDIPHDRLGAANWVLQCALFSVILTFCGLPYNSAIIVNERMNVYAIFSIIEVVLKLVFVIVLKYISGDVLIYYAFLMLLVTLIDQFLNFGYCKLNFKNLKYTKIEKFTAHFPLLKFSVWNTFGSLAVLFRTQGLNVLLNLFFGTIVNAAVGVATQIYSAISGLTSNFMMALNPQIYKSYAEGDQEYFSNIIFKGSKFSFFLMLLVAFPIMLEITPILHFWLVDVPPLTSVFSIIIILIGLIDCISTPLITGALAHGNIKNYQIVIGTTILFVLPIGFIALKLGAQPYTVYTISLIISCVSLFLRLLFLKRMINFPVQKFLAKVLSRIILVTLISIPVPIVLKNILPDNFLSFVIVVISSMILILGTSLYIGFNRSERTGFFNILKGFILKISVK